MAYLYKLCCNAILSCVFFVNKDDGLHYRQPWVIGVQEEIECLTKRVEEAEKVIKGVPNLNKKIEILEVS